MICFRCKQDDEYGFSCSVGRNNSVGFGHTSNETVGVEFSRGLGSNTSAFVNAGREVGLDGGNMVGAGISHKLSNDTTVYANVGSDMAGGSTATVGVKYSF